MSLLAPLLPAATTYSVLGLLLIASSSVAEVPANPMLAFATFAFIVPAYTRPSATAATVPMPCSSSTFTARILGPSQLPVAGKLAAPATPRLLLERAAIVPATCVPWSRLVVGLLSF